MVKKTKRSYEKEEGQTRSLEAHVRRIRQSCPLVLERNSLPIVLPPLSLAQVNKRWLYFAFKIFTCRKRDGLIL